jgi:hypothetical protein
VNRIDQETEKEARAHKDCRAIQEEEESGRGVKLTTQLHLLLRSRMVAHIS